MKLENIIHDLEYVEFYLKDIGSYTSGMYVQRALEYLKNQREPKYEVGEEVEVYCHGIWVKGKITHRPDSYIHLYTLYDSETNNWYYAEKRDIRTRKGI